MATCSAIPIDILTWGNHEHDLPHAHVMAREREYQGALDLDFVMADFLGDSGANHRPCAKARILIGTRPVSMLTACHL